MVKPSLNGMTPGPTKIFLICVPLALICLIGGLLRAPSNREKKLDRLGAAVAGRLATAPPQVVTRINKCTYFVARKPPKAIGTVTLFCPTGANLATLMRDGKNGELDNCEFRVIPTRDRDAPSSEMALVLTILEKSPEKLKWIEAVAGDPIGSKSKIKNAYAKLNVVERNRVLAQMEANRTIYDSLGRMDVMLQMGERRMLAEDMVFVNNALNREFKLMMDLR